MLETVCINPNAPLKIAHPLYFLCSGISTQFFRVCFGSHQSTVVLSGTIPRGSS